MTEKLDIKKPWQSKTIITNLVVIASAFIPQVGEWVAANPEAYASLVGLANTGIRFITVGKIKF